MKALYETPEVKLISFELEGKIMNDGDIFVDPWGDDEPSTNDVPIPGDE